MLDMALTKITVDICEACNTAPAESGCVYECMSGCVYACMSVCVYEWMRVCVYL
jgi:hypothetical protein